MNIEEFSKLIERNIDAENYAPFKDWDKSSVESSLIVLYRNKPNIKSNEIPSGFYRAVAKYYGGLKEATEKLGIKRDTSGKANNRAEKWTDKFLLESIQRYVYEGLTLKEIRELDSNLMCAIQRNYGPFSNFEAKFGITVKRSKRPPKSSKYEDRELSQFIGETQRNKLSGAMSNRYNSKLFNACRRRWGSWNKALIANGFEPARNTPRKDWTKEELKRVYLEDIHSGEQRQNVSNRGAIARVFGGISQLRAELGLNDQQEEKTILSRISIDCYMNQVFKMDIDNVNEQLLDELDVNLTYSIRHHYGSTSNYFSNIDIDRYKKPYTSFTWTKENIVWQLERWIREGYPVNYTAIQSRHKGIIVASRKLFGSYKKAFEYAGLNYEDYRIDTAMASRQGSEFENVVAEILTDLGIEYLREPSINGCHPDFVIGKHWIDAKLSEWTVSFADCGTIHKYLPHCRRLTIVYLRQLKDETYRTNELGIDMIHVSELLKELPSDKEMEYQRKLDAILELLKDNAA